VLLALILLYISAKFTAVFGAVADEGSVYRIRPVFKMLIFL